MEAQPFVDDQSYEKRRGDTLRELYRLIDSHDIDRPLLNLMRKCTCIPYWFTLQCCYGHFMHETRKNQGGLYSLSPLHDLVGPIKYRIAYLALCIQNNGSGRKLFGDLQSIRDIDPEYVQFGSAQWFWDRCVNSYVLQVEPEADRGRDTAWVHYEEALYIEKVRNQFYENIEKVVDAHLCSIRTE